MKESLRNDDVKVDIVILWVDGSDTAWISEKEKYMPPKINSYKAAYSDSRFRSWDNLQYIFRGIENYMPWVNKVFFITWGHLPSWMNTKCEKLKIVRHEDFIPKEYLPTFNSNVIELNLHRLEELSEFFINFNDDTFVVNMTKKEDFFENGLPKSEGIITPFPIRPNGISCSEARNLEIINSHFSIKDIKKRRKKWINPVYGSYNLRNLSFMQFSWIIGFLEPHNPLSIRKSTIEKLWDLEYDALQETASRKFRGKTDVNIWLARQWQMMEGNFLPRNPSFNKSMIMPRDVDKALRILKRPENCKLMCINDINCSDDDLDFNAIKEKINNALKEVFPTKSSYEL